MRTSKDKPLTGAAATAVSALMSASKDTTLTSATTVAVPALMKQEEVAEYLQVSTKWLERDRWAGPTLPFVKFGRHVRYRASDLAAFIAGAEVS